MYLRIVLILLDFVIDLISIMCEDVEKRGDLDADGNPLQSEYGLMSVVLDSLVELRNEFSVKYNLINK